MSNLEENEFQLIPDSTVEAVVSSNKKPKIKNKVGSILAFCFTKYLIFCGY
jgi:hypothetical protein